MLSHQKMVDEETEEKDLENIQWISRQVFISLISSIYAEKKGSFVTVGLRLDGLAKTIP